VTENNQKDEENQTYDAQVAQLDADTSDYIEMSDDQGNKDGYTSSCD
jgi:hypothetical protein